MFERILYTQCPVCGSYSAAEPIVATSVIEHPLWTPKFPRTIRWLSCTTCEHWFTNGYFSTEALSELARLTPPGQAPGHNPEEGRLAASRIVQWVDDAEKRWPSMLRTWLDVGIGSGALLATANEFGYDTTGLDIRAETCEEFAEYGAIYSSFEDFPSKGVATNGSVGAKPLLFAPCEGFDVISMGDVLEHLPFPKAALEKAHALLSKDGLLYLATPNADSYAWAKLDMNGENPYWKELEHFHIFTLARLVELLKDVGFQSVTARASVQYRLGVEVLARAC